MVVMVLTDDAGVWEGCEGLKDDDGMWVIVDESVELDGCLERLVGVVEMKSFSNMAG